MEKIKIKDVIVGSSLIAGTTIGAGMLGIPLVTAKAGFLPAFLVNGLVWAFMFLTGILFLEVTLWMPKDANLISMAGRFLGKWVKYFSGATFIFLYYCLMIAYFAAGAPLLFSFFTDASLGWYSYAMFGLIFGVVVAVGIHFVGRVNYILMMALVLSYLVLVVGGGGYVSIEKLRYQNWSYFFLAFPILFSAFGYHNVIPSLTFHFKENGRLMRRCIFFGTLAPLLVYLVWQWLIIGYVPEALIKETLEKGQPITEALHKLSGRGYLRMGASFFDN